MKRPLRRIVIWIFILVSLLGTNLGFSKVSRLILIQEKKVQFYFDETCDAWVTEDCIRSPAKKSPCGALKRVKDFKTKQIRFSSTALMNGKNPFTTACKKSGGQVVFGKIPERMSQISLCKDTDGSMIDVSAFEK